MFFNSHWIYTMFRCALFRWNFAGLALSAALSTLSAPAFAQVVTRSFPQDALRGTIEMGQPPLVAVNSEPARLAPGARIRGQDNMLVMSGNLIGAKMTVNYTIDTYGLVKDVWILRADEAKKVWPKTREEAARWIFDAQANAWVKR